MSKGQAYYHNGKNLKDFSKKELKQAVKKLNNMEYDLCREYAKNWGLEIEARELKSKVFNRDFVIGLLLTSVAMLTIVLCCIV